MNSDVAVQGETYLYKPQNIIKVLPACDPVPTLHVLINMSISIAVSLKFEALVFLLRF